MKALLVTYNNEKLSECRLVDVADDHDFAGGPYQDSVPLAVGSNQAIIPADDIVITTYERWLSLSTTTEQVAKMAGGAVRIVPVRVHGKHWYDVVLADGGECMETFDTKKLAEDFVRDIRWPLVE
jgi:hypothetical protein